MSFSPFILCSPRYVSLASALLPCLPPLPPSLFSLLSSPSLLPTPLLPSFSPSFPSFLHSSIHLICLSISLSHSHSVLLSLALDLAVSRSSSSMCSGWLSSSSLGSLLIFTHLKRERGSSHIKVNPSLAHFCVLWGIREYINGGGKSFFYQHKAALCLYAALCSSCWKTLIKKNCTLLNSRADKGSMQEHLEQGQIFQITWSCSAQLLAAHCIDCSWLLTQLTWALPGGYINGNKPWVCYDGLPPALKTRMRSKAQRSLPCLTMAEHSSRIHSCPGQYLSIGIISTTLLLHPLSRAILYYILAAWQTGMNSEKNKNKSSLT